MGRGASSNRNTSGPPWKSSNAVSLVINCPPSFAFETMSNQTFINHSRIFHSPVRAQGRLIAQIKIIQPNVNMRIVGRAAPEQTGQGAEVEAESRNPSNRRRYCDLAKAESLMALKLPRCPANLPSLRPKPVEW